MGTRLSRRFRPCNLNGCVLYLPFYAYGAEQIKILDQSNSHHDGTITQVVPDSRPMISGNQLVTNGTFTGDTDWTKGTGWAITTVATKTAGVASDLEQNIGAVSGGRYLLSYSLTRTAGTLTPQIGGVNGTTRSSSNPCADIITASGTGNLKFQADSSFAGTIDNVKVNPIIGYQSLGWYFNGTSSVMTITNPGDGSLDPSSGAFTFVAWVEPRQSGINMCIGGKTNGSNQGYELFYLSDNSFRLQVFDATGTSRTNVTGQSGSFIAAKCHHVVGIGNNSTIQIYVNTFFDNAPAACIGYAVNSTNFFLGRRGSSASAWWLGNMYEVMFFQRTWSFEEIKSHYETTRFRYGV